MVINNELEELVACFEEQSQTETVSIKSFCESRGISYSRFLRYRRARMSEGCPAADLVPVDFVEAEPVPARPAECIRLSFGGVSLSARAIAPSVLVALVRELSHLTTC